MIYIYEAEIVRVIDGDTFELMIDHGSSVFTRPKLRLYGIDAPELRTKAGKEVASYVAQMANFMGPKCVVQSIANSRNPQVRDKYGRYLAIIYEQMPSDPKEIINGEKLMDVAPGSLNARLVDAGLARERYWR